MFLRQTVKIKKYLSLIGAYSITIPRSFIFSMNKWLYDLQSYITTNQAIFFTVEQTPKLRSILCLTMQSRCQHAGNFRVLDRRIELALDVPVVLCCLRMMYTRTSYEWERDQDRPLETSKVLQYKHTPIISRLALRAVALLWVALYVYSEHPFDATYDTREVECPNFGLQSSHQLRVEDQEH